jgi:hypothetical protein
MWLASSVALAATEGLIPSEKLPEKLFVPLNGVAGKACSSLPEKEYRYS